MLCDRGFLSSFSFRRPIIIATTDGDDEDDDLLEVVCGGCGERGCGGIFGSAFVLIPIP